MYDCYGENTFLIVTLHILKIFYHISNSFQDAHIHVFKLHKSWLFPSFLKCVNFPDILKKRPVYMYKKI